MGRRKGKGSSLLKAALLVAASMQLLPLSDAQAPLLPPADLLLELRELVPNDFSLSVTFLVTNIGGSVSRACSISIWDEHDVVIGEGSLVLERSLGELQPGKSVTVELDWHPTTPSAHRLWAFVDPDNDVPEVTKVNNVAFGTITLPQPSDLILSVDGLIEHNRSGTYLSGVPLELQLMATIPDGLDAELFRFEMSLDNGSLPVRVWGGGGPNPTFDVDTLSPGIHRMVLSTSYAGVMLGSSSLELDCAEVPEWVWALSDPDASFDRDGGAYVLSGYLDVPTLRPLDEKAQVSTSSPMVLFDREDEVRLRAWMLPDLTTTFEVELIAGMPYSLDGSPISAKTTVFRDGRTLPGSMSLSAGSSIAVELSGSSELQGSIPVSGANLTIDPTHLTATGELSVELEMVRSESGLPHLAARAGLELAGDYEGTTFTAPLSGPGGSTHVTADLVWSSVHELKDGNWTSSGSPVLSRTALTDDLLSPEGQTARAYASMSMSRMGPYSSVYVTPWNGNQTALGMWQEGSSVLLRSGHGMMAEPSITALGDGSRVILWTELTDDGDLPPINLSRRGVWWMMVDGVMFEKVQAAPLSSGQYLDMRPSAAASPDGSAVLVSWVRDKDGNITTIKDRRLMIAYYDGSRWTDPLDVGAAMSSTVLFTEEGVPVVSYVDINWAAWVRTLRLRAGKLEETGGKNGLMMPEGCRALEVSALQQAGTSAKQSGILLVRSGRADEGRWVLSVQTLESSTSLYGQVPSREDVIAISDHLMESPCGDQLDSGYTAVMWREATGGNGTLRMAASPAGADWSTWTGALDLDHGLQMTPSFSFRAVEAGKFWTVMGTMLPRGYNTTLVPVRIALDEMTWACEVASIKAQPPEGYGPGDLVSVEVSVVNRGLVPDGTASIKLLRTVRSKEDGSLQDQLVSTENMRFSELNERKVLTFSVTVADMQMGLWAQTSTPRGVLPAFSDEAYTSLPAYPDPVISSISADEGMPGGNVTVRMTVINMGHSRMEHLPLVLRAVGPTHHVAYGPGRMEPVGLRRMEGGREVSSHMLTLGPMEEVTVVMGFDPGNGTTALWAEIEGCNWLKEVPRSDGPLIVRRAPVPEVRVTSVRPLGSHGDTFSFSLSVLNKGTGGSQVTVRDSKVGGPPDGLGQVMPLYSVRLWLTDGTRYSTLLHNGEADIPQPGSVIDMTMEPMGSDLAPGSYVVMAGLVQDMGAEGSGPMVTRAAMEVHILPNGTVATGRPTLTAQPSGPEALSVPLENPAGRTYWGIIVTVTNGRQRDGLVLSEHLVVSIAPREYLVRVHRPQLKEGSYLLSASVLSFSPTALSSSDGMSLADTYLFEHQVVKTDERPARSGPDSEDVTSAAIVSGAALLVVLSAGATFRLERRDEDR